MGNNDYKSSLLDYDCTSCRFEGYNIKINNKSIADRVILDISLEKNIPTKIIAIIINTVLFTMSVLVLIMGIRILREHKAPEMSALGFAVGLLFAFPAVRNVMPGVPPIGALIDYFGLFPGEFFVSISLFILATCWLKKGGSFTNLKPSEDKKDNEDIKKHHKKDIKC